MIVEVRRLNSLLGEIMRNKVNCCMRIAFLLKSGICHGLGVAWNMLLTHLKQWALNMCCNMRNILWVVRRQIISWKVRNQLCVCTYVCVSVCLFKRWRRRQGFFLPLSSGKVYAQKGMRLFSSSTFVVLRLVDHALSLTRLKYKC